MNYGTWHIYEVAEYFFFVSKNTKKIPIAMGLA